MMIEDIRTTWARPLYEFLSFFWLRSAKVLQVRARLRQHQRWFDLYYPQPLARSSRQHAKDASQGIAPFCALGDILAREYDFDMLLQRYFCGHHAWVFHNRQLLPDPTWDAHPDRIRQNAYQHAPFSSK